MEKSERLPEAIPKAQSSLEPYIKPRQETSQIRRILASHLSLHVNPSTKFPISRPLSLVNTEVNTDAAPHGIRGIQREYLRYVRANVKAKEEYNKLRKEHQQAHGDHGSAIGLPDSSVPQDATSMDSFLDLVRQRKKHDRLRIFQDYVDMLVQKPAAATQYLDPQLILKDVESLPKVPPEVSNGSSRTRVSGEADLKELVDQLEKWFFVQRCFLTGSRSFLQKSRLITDWPLSVIRTEFKHLGRLVTS